MNIERNIHLGKNGKLLVYVTRRNLPRAIYGGTFERLEEARVVRDRIEADYPPSPPHAFTPRKDHRKTREELWAEREARGMCVLCGEDPPRPGKRSCFGCAAVRSVKWKARREHAYA